MINFNIIISLNICICSRISIACCLIIELMVELWTTPESYFFAFSLLFAKSFTSHTNNSMHYDRICFIFAALKNLILKLQNKMILVVVCLIYKKLFNCKIWRVAKVANRITWRSNPNIKKDFFSLKNSSNVSCYRYKLKRLLFENVIERLSQIQNYVK